MPLLFMQDRLLKDQRTEEQQISGPLLLVMDIDLFNKKTFRHP